MKTWELSEARHHLDEVVRRAQSCGPQRISGDSDAAVVLSTADYHRLVAEADPMEDDLCPGDDAPAGEGMSFFEMMQSSPLAEAFRTGEISADEWDRACRIGR